jgi:uncharacterized membrane protein
MLFEWARYLHIAAGFTALLIFWIPIVTKKGSPLHTRVGWVYIWAMTVVAISALVMGTYRIFFDPQADAERQDFSLFLIFIAILSSASAWFGIRVLRHKKRTGIHTHKLDLFFSLLLFGGGIAVSAYGFVRHFPLIAWFPLIGVGLGFNQLRYWLTPPKTKMGWLFEHLSSMMGCCIATITAFTVFGAPRLLHVSSVHPLLWFLPTMVIVPLIIGFNRHYQKKLKAR